MRVTISAIIGFLLVSSIAGLTPSAFAGFSCPSGVVYTWIGGDGNFGTGSNWDQGTSPGQLDEWDIDNAPGTNSIVRITSSENLFHLLTLDVGDRIIIESGGSFNHDGDQCSPPPPPATVNADGIIEVQSGGTLTQTSGTFNANGGICGPGTINDSEIDPIVTSITLGIACAALEAVGGTAIGIDNVSLLLVGFEMNAFWFMPALILAGAGITLFRLGRK